MADLPFAFSTHVRLVAEESIIAFRNRYIEKNPVLTDGPAAAIARPALKKFMDIGEGPIRKIFSEPGVFDGDAFVVSGSYLYRVRVSTGDAVLIGSIGFAEGDVSCAATAPIGAELAHLFFASGGVLWLYMESPAAEGTLTFAGAPANSDVVRIDGVYYQYTTGSVDTGSPAGTLANPWLVARSGTTATDVASLGAAIDATGTPGTTYSTALTEHTTVSTLTVGGSALVVQADAEGPSGNSIVTTETGANTSWGGGTLSGGGAVTPLSQVSMPDDVGAISVAHINSYILVVPVQREDYETVGRFYWIVPGEITVDPMDFATAERAPDKIHQVVVFGDLFWLCGQKTTEPWQTTGDPDAPMLRYQGILFDRGSWEGTAVQVKDCLIIVDENGGVFKIAGGSERISNPGIEERIRRAIQNQAYQEIV